MDNSTPFFEFSRGRSISGKRQILIISLNCSCIEVTLLNDHRKPTFSSTLYIITSNLVVDYSYLATLFSKHYLLGAL